MSGDTSIGADTQMVNSILADAEAQVAKILAEAKVTADAELSKADEEANAVRADLLNRATEKAKRLCSREQALATVEARRSDLRAREAAVQKVFELTLAELAVLHASPQAYRESLMFLASEALRGISEPHVRLSFADADRAVVDPPFLEALQAEMLKRLSSTPKIEVSFDLPDPRGGCIAKSPSGHVTFDNTYTQRFERAKRSLRTAILKEVPTS